MTLLSLAHKLCSRVFKDAMNQRQLTARSIPHSASLSLRYAQTSPELQYDQELMNRLLVAYQVAEEHAKTANLPELEADMWDTIVNQEMQAFKSAVDNGDTREMFDYLSKIGKDYVWFGGLTLGIDGYTPKNWSSEKVVWLYWEKLVALGEACGAICIENPESGPYHSNIQLGPEELLQRIEEKLGVSLTPPDNVLPTSGLGVGSSVFHYRHINGIYGAQILTRLVPAGGRVAEIGGGLGLLAIYSQRMKPLQYEIYDLPISCIISGFFLLHALGPDQVCLLGELHDKQPVHIKPFWTLADIQSNQLDLAVNQDGLNEIDMPTVEFLVRNLERATKSRFLSLNHETFGTDRRVSAYVQKFTSMTRLWRSKTWVREGYVDELYECSE